MKERRLSARKKSFLQGRVYYNSRRSSVDCLVRDISDEGAKLVFGEPMSGAIGDLKQATRIARLMVTQFDASRVKPGRSIRIRTQPEYWAAVRAATDWCIVDAPALERASAGLAITSQMDRTVLVVKADATLPSEVDALRREILEHSGRIGGAVLNRERADARFIDRLAS